LYDDQDGKEDSDSHADVDVVPPEFNRDSSGSNLERERSKPTDGIILAKGKSPSFVDEPVGICEERAVDGIHDAELTKSLGSAENHDTNNDISDNLRQVSCKIQEQQKESHVPDLQAHQSTAHLRNRQRDRHLDATVSTLRLPGRHARLTDSTTDSNHLHMAAHQVPGQKGLPIESIDGKLALLMVGVVIGVSAIRSISCSCSGFRINSVTHALPKGGSAWGSLFHGSIAK
jgi:hypothetical protein